MLLSELLSSFDDLKQKNLTLGVFKEETLKACQEDINIIQT